MSQETGSALAIQLNDGRTIIGTPGPEDQDRLAQFGDRQIILSASATDTDTYGHSFSSEVTLDVEGHAVTLRLPTPADADALRNALAVGVITATLVAAGVIAAMQGGPATSAGQNVIDSPRSAPAPAEDFQTRREREIDRMLEAPAGGLPAADAPANHRVGGPRD